MESTIDKIIERVLRNKDLSLFNASDSIKVAVPLDAVDVIINAGYKKVLTSSSTVPRPGQYLAGPLFWPWLPV